MVFEHEGWTLYSRDVTLKGGRNQTIYLEKNPKKLAMRQGVNKRDRSSISEKEITSF